MRKSLVALLFAASLPLMAQAAPQHAGDVPPPPAHGFIEHGSQWRNLDLTPEQHRQINALQREQGKQQKELTRRYLDKLPTDQQQALKKERQAIHEQQKKAIRTLLSSEQQKKWDEQQKKRAERQAEWAEFKAWKAQQKK